MPREQGFFRRMSEERKPEAAPVLPAEQGPRKPATPEELSACRKMMQEVLDTHRNLFNTFAKDTSLSFEVSEQFAFDYETGRIFLDAQWFADRKFTRLQMLWAVLHELTHFRDHAEDPKAFERNRGHLLDNARREGKAVMEKFERAYAGHPDVLNRLKQPKPISQKDKTKTVNAAEEFGFRAYHMMFNCLDDVWVNRTVGRRAATFDAKAKGGREIQSLYKQLLFPGTDFTAMPRHLQFIQKLLRDEMAEDEPAEVGSEVQAILEKKIKYKGRLYTPREIVEQFVIPARGRRTSASDRYAALTETLEPIFTALLRQDLEEWEPPPAPPEIAGALPFAIEYGEAMRNSPDQLDEGDMQAFIEGEEGEGNESQDEAGAGAGGSGSGAQPVKPSEPPPNIFHAQKRERIQKMKEEKARRLGKPSPAPKPPALAPIPPLPLPKREVIPKPQINLNLQDLEWCRKQQLDPKSFAELLQLEEQVTPYREELSRLWTRIIYGSSPGLKRGLEGHYATGVDMDLPKVIEEFPKLESGKVEDVRAMKRMVEKVQLVEKPELIRVRLLCDMSGSMQEPPWERPEKIPVLRRTVALLMSSLDEFNTRLNLTRHQTKSRLKVETELRRFDFFDRIIKPFGGERYGVNDRVELAKSLEQLKFAQGGTSDDLSYQAILDSLTDKERKAMAQKKTMELVFEITDGQPRNPGLTRTLIERLMEEGAIVRGFQIGQVSVEEERSFNQIWNDHRPEPLGAVVGTRIENLLPAVAQVLKKYLEHVQL